METVEELLALFADGSCNVDCLVGYPDDAGDRQVGVRIRPWTTGDKDKMVLCAGDSFRDALAGAFAKAKAGRWEPLDWSRRPWNVSRTRSTWR